MQAYRMQHTLEYAKLNITHTRKVKAWGSAVACREARLGVMVALNSSV